MFSSAASAYDLGDKCCCFRSAGSDGSWFSVATVAIAGRV